MISDTRSPEAGPSAGAGTRSINRWSALVAAARSDRRVRILSAVLLAAAWGIAAGVQAPRGPLTTSAALCSLAVSVAVGAGAGLLMGSRRAILLAPVAFAVGLEFARLGADGPMVDAPHLSTYGLIAMATGRGFHALLTLVPMAFGAAVGAGVARSRAGERVAGAWHLMRRAGTGVVGLALLGLAVALARPATTAPIVDWNGNAIPGSVAQVTTVELGGRDLSVLIRGTSTDNPVLLFLAGGPGGSEFGAMRRHLQALEQHFTVVTWDQRGAGTSYRELDPADSVTLAGYVADTIELTEHLRDRFDTDQIYLVGQSWGTTLGVLAVQQRPDLYRAYVGTGQMVSQRATDQIFYEDTLAWARRTGDDGLLARLESAGPPPYAAVFPYESALSHEQDMYPYDHNANSEGVGQMSENLLVPEYSLIDQVHVLGAFMDTFTAVYPQLQDIDFRMSATDFEVPMFFVQGAHEAPGRAEPFNDWYPMVSAPQKDLVVLDTSGHRPLWEQPDEFVDYMVDTVLARTLQ